MKINRVIVGGSLTAAVALGAFLAGGVQHGASVADAAAGKPVIVQLAQPQTGSSIDTAKLTLAVAGPAKSLAAGYSAQATTTPEPTEIAGAPEIAEPAGTPEAAEPVGAAASAEAAEPVDAAEPADGADNEAADAAALAAQASITAQQAEQTALAANPGATLVKSELGDENGTIVYEVELSNGSDVKVDAKSGAIVSTDQAGSDNESGSQHEGADGD